ncbi:Thioredoxin [Tritrichomonas foetus]|uniref:Thioredoxin n=1 Tax=Tritrichomonas foetus TaxID=1144522 RepID=A0A1J4KQ51_9EUKA|nr:Thioredoxin [Tritrichomonas foetus]|eukprot:OHT11822.1 Thioredoxin [Tritrichomonas foetus]
MSHPENVLVLPANTQPAAFKDLVQAEAGLVLVDFFATWCPPCQRLVAEIPNLAGEYPKVKFIKVNVEENEAVASQFNVSSIPHVSFLKAGDGQPQVLETIVGFNLAKIKQTLQSLS